MPGSVLLPVGQLVGVRRPAGAVAVREIRVGTDVHDLDGFGFSVWGLLHGMLGAGGPEPATPDGLRRAVGERHPGWSRNLDPTLQAMASAGMVVAVAPGTEATTVFGNTHRLLPLVPQIAELSTSTTRRVAQRRFWHYALVGQSIAQACRNVVAHSRQEVPDPDVTLHDVVALLPTLLHDRHVMIDRMPAQTEPDNRTGRVPMTPHPTAPAELTFRIGYEARRHARDGTLTVRSGRGTTLLGDGSAPHTVDAAGLWRRAVTPDEEHRSGYGGIAGLHAHGWLVTVPAAPDPRSVAFLRRHRVLPLLELLDRPDDGEYLLGRPESAPVVLRDSVFTVWRMAAAMPTAWQLFEAWRHHGHGGDRVADTAAEDPALGEFLAALHDLMTAGAVHLDVAVLGNVYLDQVAVDRDLPELRDAGAAPPALRWTDEGGQSTPAVDEADLLTVAGALRDLPTPWGDPDVLRLQITLQGWTWRPGWVWNDERGPVGVELRPGGPDGELHHGELVLPVGVCTDGSVQAARDAFGRAARALESELGPAPVLGCSATAPVPPAGTGTPRTVFLRWPGERSTLELRTGRFRPRLALLANDAAQRTPSPGGVHGRRIGDADDHEWDLGTGWWSHSTSALLELLALTWTLDLHVRVQLRADRAAGAPLRVDLTCGSELQLAWVHTGAETEVAPPSLGWTATTAPDGTVVGHHSPPVRPDDDRAAREVVRLLATTASALDVSGADALTVSRMWTTRRALGAPPRHRYHLTLPGIGLGLRRGENLLTHDAPEADTRAGAPARGGPAPSEPAGRLWPPRPGDTVLPVGRLVDATGLTGTPEHRVENVRPTVPAFHLQCGSRTCPVPEFRYEVWALAHRAEGGVPGGPRSTPESLRAAVAAQRPDRLDDLDTELLALAADGLLVTATVGAATAAAFARTHRLLILDPAPSRIGRLAPVAWAPDLGSGCGTEVAVDELLADLPALVRDGVVAVDRAVDDSPSSPWA